MTSNEKGLTSSFTLPKVTPIPESKNEEANANTIADISEDQELKAFRD